MEIINLILSSIIVIIMPLTFIKITLDCEFKESKAQKIIAVIIATVAYILSYKYTTGIYKTIISFLIHLVLINSFYKITFKKSIYSIIIFIIFLIIPDFAFLLILTKLFGFTKEYCYTVISGSLISNIAVCILMIIITYILRKPLKMLINVKINFNNKITIFLILTLISILIFFYDIIASFRIGTKIIFYVISIITFISALIYVIFQENKNLKLKLEYNKLLEFMETYEVELENQRILKHEYKNHLITIKSKLIDKDKKNKIVDYIDSILGDYIKFSQESYTKLQYLPANGIKALFYFKISEAKNKGINTSVNIAQSVKQSALNKLNTKEFKDLGILIGVYLDNAIEASVESDKKQLGIEIYNTDEGVIMIISNSYKHIIEESKLGKIRFSTKGKGHGYGLILVSNTLRNNNKLKCETEITDTLYIQTVLIKNS